MKKLFAGIITAAVVLSLTAVSAFAAPRCSWAVERICSGVQTARMCHLRFVDADGDGVCDNYNPELCPGNGQDCVQGQGQGQCQGQGQGQGQGWAHHGGGHHR